MNNLKFSVGDYFYNPETHELGRIINIYVYPPNLYRCSSVSNILYLYISNTSKTTDTSLKRIGLILNNSSVFQFTLILISHKAFSKNSTFFKNTLVVNNSVDVLKKLL